MDELYEPIAQAYLGPATIELPLLGELKLWFAVLPAPIECLGSRRLGIGSNVCRISVMFTC
jgi:hypothetical protein